MSLNFFKSVKNIFSKTSRKIGGGISAIFTNRKLDAEVLEDLEALLISADLGPGITDKIIQKISSKKYDKNITPEMVEEIIGEQIYSSLAPCEKTFELSSQAINGSSKPLTVIVMCGVNGNGKTTSIAKLANHIIKQGYKVSVAACDTFRAAAVEQLQIWSERVNCPIIVADNPKADPASVAYRAVKSALENEDDVLFIDTAGRLHNQTNLMAELRKIISTIEKLIGRAPDYSMLVLDATIGQHAYMQVEEFQKEAGVNGLIVTKLDGSAKAGVVVGLAEKFTLPIYFLGTGETSEDITPFDAQKFAKDLVLRV